MGNVTFLESVLKVGLLLEHIDFLNLSAHVLNPPSVDEDYDVVDDCEQDAGSQ